MLRRKHLDDIAANVHDLMVFAILNYKSHCVFNLLFD